MISEIDRLIATAPGDVPTRKGEIARLSSRGIVGPAADMMAGISAVHRHYARTRAAIRAAAEYVEGIMPSMPHDMQWVAHLWAILAVDEIGTGSTATMPSDGGSTTRFPAFAGCGKGRKQARDGGAWTAAIADAAQRIAQEAGACFQWQAYVACDQPFIRLADTLLGETFPLSEDLFPAEWEAALAAYHLKQHANSGRIGGRDLTPEESADIQGWTSLYNEAVGLMRATAQDAAGVAAEKAEEDQDDG